MQFICDQGLLLDNSAGVDDIYSSYYDLCMQFLMKFFRVTLNNKSVRINN